MFKIEKNIPLPSGGAGGKESKYPFMQMEIGDSFQAPDEQRNAIRSMATYHTRKHKMRFIVRKDGEAHVRIWRVA
jgi:hypothetical protein